jgi:uncharacterized membrane protein YhaH (DUF805 family)
MSEAEPSSEARPFIVALFSVTGRIGPKHYWLNLLCAFAVFAALVGAMGLAMDPRGSSDGAILALPLLGLFVWIVMAAMIQRLRDAGRHPALAILAVILLMGVIFLSVELIEAAPLFGIIAVPIMFLIVGHSDSLKAKPVPE